MTKIKKRFMAGATCPKCRGLDCIMIYTENAIEKIECVDCGYQEQQPSAPAKDPNLIGMFKPH